MNTLCFGSLNVCCLKRRIHYLEFIETIQKFDILCLSETKLTDTDVISCDGFTFFNQPRRQKIILASGGIGFLVKILFHLKNQNLSIFLGYKYLNNFLVLNKI